MIEINILKRLADLSQDKDWRRAMIRTRIDKSSQSHTINLSPSRDVLVEAEPNNNVVDTLL